MKTSKTRLNGLTEEQQQQISHAVSFIVETVFYDLQAAMRACGEPLTNTGLMCTVADHLHDYNALYDGAGPPVDPSTLKAWLAIDWAARRAWLDAEHKYI